MLQVLVALGKLTREQLSQLLLAYMAMAADIIELFECFKEDTVTENVELIYATLGEVWPPDGLAGHCIFL